MQTTESRLSVMMVINSRAGAVMALTIAGASGPGSAAVADAVAVFCSPSVTKNRVSRPTPISGFPATPSRRFGAPGQTRTGTSSQTTDFESAASTDSATGATVTGGIILSSPARSMAFRAAHGIGLESRLSCAASAAGAGAWPPLLPNAAVPSGVDGGNRAGMAGLSVSGPLLRQFVIGKRGGAVALRRRVRI